MRLNPTDRIILDQNNITVTRGEQSGTCTASEKIIKSNRSWTEWFTTAWCAITGGDDCWKKRNVEIIGANGPTTKTMYVFERNLNVSLSPRRDESPELVPLLSNKPVTPKTVSAASSRSISPVSVKKFEPTPAQLKQIVNANRLCEWIGELRKTECKVKINGLDLSLEPRGGVKHDLIDSSVSTGAYNLLACTFITLQAISPSKWKPSDSSKPPALNYDKYIDACNDTIAQLKAKKSMSSDDEINLGLINAALILAKGFQQIKSGSTKTDKTFLGSQFNLNILADYVIKYDQFGSKKLT